ncbi:uncharacterized protein A4U43_C04F2740 [Asparagus officinalis]|uniref:indole-3-pyruvate monooxygenase n=1 Tax=Asparagus officinalis TaxID=4686 RepID=A0A5P1EXU7_ASPOF|nr:uncharacterized protein A4U43_C04F2740 [Asparagus officinalis]
MGPQLPDSVDFLSRKCMWVNGPIIIGAGPSGLAVAASLKEHGVPYVILERSDCIASLWQKRTYDRLKLHLPKQFCQLPGLLFPDSYPEYPCKKQFVDYLESYAKHFNISPKFNQSVQSAKYNETSGLWHVRAIGTQHEEVEYIGKWLVVATELWSEETFSRPFELKTTHGRNPVLDYGALSKIMSGEIEVVPGVKRFMPGRVEFVDGGVLEFDVVVMATGYSSNVPYWLQGTDFFSKDGIPKVQFPNTWKKSGLYTAGFTIRGLAGASSDAVKVAKDLSKGWKEETSQEASLLSDAPHKSTNQLYFLFFLTMKI